jgi:hypothetical protein
VTTASSEGRRGHCLGGRACSPCSTCSAVTVSSSCSSSRAEAAANHTCGPSYAAWHLKLGARHGLFRAVSTQLSAAAFRNRVAARCCCLGAGVGGTCLERWPMNGRAGAPDHLGMRPPCSAATCGVGGGGVAPARPCSDAWWQA